MSQTHHAEWLSLMDISGPFLSPPVLDRVFPQGLDAHDSDHSAKLRMVHEEWADEQQMSAPDPAIHDAWVRFVLGETLGLTPEVLLEGPGVPEELSFTSPEHDETLRPDFLVLDPETEPGVRRPRLLVSVWPAGTELEQPISDARWTASPVDRMVALCRSEGVGLRLGLVTNGERWALVDAPVGETSAHASWYASLWGQEPLTLRAFRSLLGLQRFFGVAEGDRLEAMLIESANYQTDVTDQLGFQVRRAVEVLVQAIDRADADTGRALLADTDPARIYEAALTVMMRLVFLFSAEERGLLLLNTNDAYDQFYAVSTLRAQLREAADHVGEEVLERRRDAWSRLLGTFRAIYGGIHHEALQIIPYGSSLFDPGRFPFLEGRGDETDWRTSESRPLPIDNRTVLLLLESLQLLDLGKGKGARKLSFRALGIEQIGHVYETLLDHTALRATEPMVSLQGNQGREPEISVSKLHDLAMQEGDEAIVEFLKAELKKSPSAIRKSLAKDPDPDVTARLQTACGGDRVLFAKLLPFNDLIRLDPWGDPVVIPEGAVFVTAGEDRRSTGTHYTPRALTEEIVQYTLEPVVYRGPSEGKDRDEWEVKSPSEILDLKVCDPAMGSGAFLVQACRYLSERLMEAWEQGGFEGLVGAESQSAAGTDVVPTDPEERLSLARRLVADRCLYGVDVNPLAVEMAKLSMWLITLARDTPFTFLDHALKCGDSLLGIDDLDQIRHFHPDPKRGKELHSTLFDPTARIGSLISKALDFRTELEGLTVRDSYDAERKQRLNNEAEASLGHLRLLGDLVTGWALERSDLGSSGDGHLSSMAASAQAYLDDSTGARLDELRVEATRSVNYSKPSSKPDRRPFHWPIEFPEVFSDSDRFDAIVMNPPFLGGSKVTGELGDSYREVLVEQLAKSKRGNADLCAYFLLRASQLARNVGTLATNTISQGDTREVGLEQLVSEGWQISRAYSSRTWPGSATLEIAQLGLTRQRHHSKAWLDGALVSEIGPDLSRVGRVRGKPERLTANQNLAHIGSYVHGVGFLLEPEEKKAFLRRSPESRTILRPFLIGDDVNNQIGHRASRFVINFADITLKQAQAYPEALEIVRTRVKPQRDLLKRKSRRERWWQFAEARPLLYEAIKDLDRVIAITRVSKTLMPAVVPADQVFGDALIVFASDNMALFAFLSSSFHWWWALTHASTLRVDPRYVPTDCFETLPLPDLGSGDLQAIGEELHLRQRESMTNRAIGLTQTYNRVHDPEATGGVERIRELHVALDGCVRSLYGWDDVAMNHDFRPTRLGLRFTLSAEAESEILDRLLELNHRRFDEEAARGLHGEGDTSKPLARRHARPQPEALFD